VKEEDSGERKFSLPSRSESRSSGEDPARKHLEGIEGVPDNPEIRGSDDSTEARDSESLELTPRDLEIFRFMHEQRYLAYNQIQSAFWPKCAEETKACRARIEKLKTEGYLTKRPSARIRNLALYFATAKSFEELKKRGRDSGIPLYEPTLHFERTIKHDLNVTNLRILFKELGLATWTSERLLRERDHLLSRLPDGVLNLFGKKVAIEFENDLTKSTDRYRKLLSDYKDHKEYFLVFLVIAGNLKDWLVSDLDYDVKQMWMTTYKELMNRKQKAQFENKGAYFELSRIL